MEDVSLKKLENGDYQINFVVPKEVVFNGGNYTDRKWLDIETHSFDAIVRQFTKRFIDENYDKIVGKININSIVKTVTVQVAREINKTLD